MKSSLRKPESTQYNVNSSDEDIPPSQESATINADWGKEVDDEEVGISLIQSAASPKRQELLEMKEMTDEYHQSHGASSISYLLSEPSLRPLAMDKHSFCADEEVGLDDTLTEMRCLMEGGRC